VDQDSALLVLISPEWINIKDAKGRRRLDASKDAVRLETADGIRDGAAILPVLLENARMPDESELPSDLRPLADFNALKLRDGDWSHDLMNILRTLEASGFRPVDTPLAAASGAQRAAPVARRGLGPKIIIGGMLTLWGWAAFIIGGDEFDRDAYLGLITLSSVGLILGILSWFENRHDTSAARTSSIVLAVFAGLALWVAIAGLSESLRSVGESRLSPRCRVALSAERFEHSLTLVVSHGRPMSDLRSFTIARHLRGRAGDLPRALVESAVPDLQVTSNPQQGVGLTRVTDGGSLIRGCH
jgi:hypothetical protein